MKKAIIILVVLILSFIVASCNNTSDTKVRLLSVSYSKENTVLRNNQNVTSLNSLLSNTIDTSQQDYVYPGETLVFSIVLEDPEFEFITLLSIKFDNKTIRANVDDSLVTTRDCGDNICIDFPFQAVANKNELTVQEVKFAKINYDNGINVVIDRNSNNKITLNLYDKATSPYVNEAVELLNRAFSSYVFYEKGTNTTDDVANMSQKEDALFRDPFRSGRAFIINKGEEYFNGETIAAIKIEYDRGDGYFEADYEFFYYAINGNIMSGIYGHGQLARVSSLGLGYYQNDVYKIIETPILYLDFHLIKYKDVNFFNIDNKLYINILGTNFFLFEFFKGMRLELLTEKHM